MNSGEYLQHDKFCRSMLRDVELIIAFIKLILDHKLIRMLDFNTIEFVKESYFGKNLKEHRSDVVVRISLKKEYKEKNKDKPVTIALLIEHKSQKNKYTLLQILRYLVIIWGEDIDNGRELTPIIPILIHHGKNKWNKRTRFRMCFSRFCRKLLGKLIPDFDYITADMNEIDPNNITNVKLYFLVQLLANSHNGNLGKALKWSLKKLDEEALPGEIGTRYYMILKRSIEYVSGSTKIKPEEIYQMISTLENKELKTKALTLAEKMERIGEERGIEIGKVEGIEIGKVEGIEIGKVEERKKMIRFVKELKIMGLKTEQIAKASGLSEEEIENI